MYNSLPYSYSEPVVYHIVHFVPLLPRGVNNGGIKQSILEPSKNIVPTSFICRLISQCHLALQTSSAISLECQFQHVGCRVVSKHLASDMGLQYYEITTDDFDAQIENAIRLNCQLLFYCSEFNITSDSWMKMVEFSKSGDIFSLVTVEQALSVIDPRGYLTEKHKVKATAVSQLQKLWQRAKVVMVPKVKLPELPTIKVGKWSEQDWTDYLIGKTSSFGISEDNCRFVSHFITNHAKTHFSPKLVHQMLLINQKFGVERLVSCFKY